MDLQTLRKCHGCRYCAGKGRTTESFIKELNNPNIEILGEYTYANSHIKCRCEIDGTIWKSTPNRLLSGQGCPECGRIIANLHSTKSNEDFLEELANKKPTIRPLGKYIGVFIPIKFECLVCGHKWDMTPDSALHTDRVCPKCTKKRNLERMTKTNAQFLEELSMVNPDLQPLEPYKTDHEKIKVLCKSTVLYGMSHQIKYYIKGLDVHDVPHIIMSEKQALFLSLGDIIFKCRNALMTVKTRILYHLIFICQTTI